ncbi:MAG: glycosyltransferase [Candidatus Fermentibacteria bacterium]|nr:glycosyltransferase [Candidatus Fermentibacteria bacterium]
MKILQVYKDVFPEISGGIERYLRDLSIFLKSRGHTIEILAAGGEDRIVDGLKVSGMYSPVRILSNPVVPGFTRYLSDTDADVIHFHLPLPAAVMAWALVKKKKRRPYIVTYHSDIVRQSFAMPIYGPILKRFLQGAAKVIATSEKYIRTSRFLRELDNSKAIPIGVDLDSFKPDINAKKDYYLFVGRFRKYKGIFVLLKAWRKMSNPPRLILAGGGGLVTKIRASVIKNELPVTIAVDVSDHELIKLYQGARALILPSIHRSEAYGMVQVEAMACGTAIISSDLPTGVSWVNKNNETGLHFATGDSTALCDCVIELEKSPETREMMYLNSRKRAERFFHSTILFRDVEECLINAIEN